MKKIISVVLTGVLALGVLTGCGGATTSTTTSTTTSKAEGETASNTKPIKIAVVGPLTGDYAEYGLGFKNSVELAANFANEEGGVIGRTVEVVAFDDKNSSEEAASIAEKIVSDKDISAVIGHFSSGVAMTAAQTYQESGIVLLSATSSHPDYSSIGDYIFRNNLLTGFETQNTLQIAYNEGAKKIGILSLKTDWGIAAKAGIEENMKALSEKADIEVVAQEEVLDGTTDFSAIISKFEAAGTDTIVVLAMYNILAPFAIQYKAANPNIKLTSVSSAHSTELVKLAGPAVEGMKLPGALNIESTDPIVRKYVDGYKEYTNGGTPSHLIAQSYDNANIVFEAIKRANTDDRTAIKDELYNTDQATVIGNVTFNETGDVVKPQIELEIKEGKFVEVKDGIKVWEEFLANIK